MDLAKDGRMGGHLPPPSCRQPDRDSAFGSKVYHPIDFLHLVVVPCCKLRHVCQVAYILSAHIAALLVEPLVLVYLARALLVHERISLLLY